MFSNVSNTRNIVFPIGHVQTMFKDYSANINNTLRFVRANVSQKMSPSLPRWELNTSKHRQETMFPQKCFLVCPALNSEPVHLTYISVCEFTVSINVNWVCPVSSNYHS